MQTCGFYSFFPGVMGPSLSGSGGIFTSVPRRPIDQLIYYVRSINVYKGTWYGVNSARLGSRFIPSGHCIPCS